MSVFITKTVKFIFKAADRLVNTLFITLLLLLLILTVYITSENKRILDEADSKVYTAYKPTSEDTTSFDELRAINNEIVGWLTIDDTKIDYPLTHTTNNDKYVNTSATGEFSLSGALFLDFRNAPDFSDPLTVIYGHNMTDDMMFGVIGKYSDPFFFKEHKHGTLFFGGDYYDVSVFAYLIADAHDTNVYSPTLKEDGVESWIAHVRETAVNFDSKPLNGGRMLLLSTCSSGITNGRDLLAAVITPGGKPPEAKEVGHSTSPAQLSGIIRREKINIYIVYMGIALAVLTVIYFILKRRKKKKHEQGK